MGASNGKFVVKLAGARVEKELDSLPDSAYKRIKEKILSLSVNPRPHGIKKLSDKVFRVRIGDYRVVYSIFDNEKIILIDKVARRSESTYKKI